MIAYAQCLKMNISIQLFIIIVCHFGKFDFILRKQYRDAVTPKIRTGHGYDVSIG